MRVLGIMRVVDQERLARYRTKYPDDYRCDARILEELDHVKKEKSRYIDDWIMREVWERKPTLEKIRVPL